MDTDTDSAKRAEDEWRVYEVQIVEWLRSLVGDGGSIEPDVKKQGRFSGVKRQVDIWVAGAFAGRVDDSVTAVVECKHFTRKVDVKSVEAFMGFVEDVGADLGIMVTTKGYSRAAKARALGGRYRLHVVPSLPKIEIVDFDERDDWEPDWFSGEAPVYVGEFYDFTPYGDSGTSVAYVAGLDSEDLMSGTQVGWHDDVERRQVIGALMRHHLGRDPDVEAIEGFLEEYRDRLEDGMPFDFKASEVAHMAF
jgi:hypothetical protein